MIKTLLFCAGIGVLGCVAAFVMMMIKVAVAASVGIAMHIMLVLTIFNVVVITVCGVWVALWLYKRRKG